MQASNGRRIEVDKRAFIERMRYQKSESDPVGIEIMLAGDKKSKEGSSKDFDYVKGTLTSLDTGTLECSVDTSTLKNFFYKIFGKKSENHNNLIENRSEMELTDSISHESEKNDVRSGMELADKISHESEKNDEIFKNKDLENIDYEAFFNAAQVIVIAIPEILQKYFSNLAVIVTSPMNLKEISFVQKVFFIAYKNPFVSFLFRHF